MASPAAPITVVANIASAQMSAAVAQGMPTEQAAAAGSNFQKSLAQQLSQGVPMTDAVAKATAIFKAEAAFPAAASPQEAAVKNIAASADSNALGTRLTQLSGASTPAGTQAFADSLGAALANGGSFANAVATAQQAVQVQASLAMVDTNNPAQALTGAGNTQAFANMPAQAQTAMGNLLAQGIPFAEANRMATAAQSALQQAARADAANPNSGIASGNPAGLSKLPQNTSFSNTLSSSMGSGMSFEDALKRAVKADAELQRLANVDVNNPKAGFANGAMNLPKQEKGVDQAIAVALARGETPTQALEMAQKIAKALPPEKPSTSSALVSGNQTGAMLASPANSKTYAKVLSNALDRGIPIDKAITMARRAETESAVRLPLPKAVSALLNQPANNGAQPTLLTSQGKPLPSWLKFDPATQGIVAHDIPVGGLPIQVTFKVGNQQTTVQITEQTVMR